MAKGGRATAKSMSQLQEEEVLQKWAGYGISPMMVRDYRLLMGGSDGTPFKILLWRIERAYNARHFQSQKANPRLQEEPMMSRIVTLLFVGLLMALGTAAPRAI